MSLRAIVAGDETHTDPERINPIHGRPHWWAGQHQNHVGRLCERLGRIREWRRRPCCRASRLGAGDRCPALTVPVLPGELGAAVSSGRRDRRRLRVCVRRVNQRDMHGDRGFRVGECLSVCHVQRVAELRLLSERVERLADIDCLRVREGSVGDEAVALHGDLQADVADRRQLARPHLALHGGGGRRDRRHQLASQPAARHRLDGLLEQRRPIRKRHVTAEREVRGTVTVRRDGGPLGAIPLLPLQAAGIWGCGERAYHERQHDARQPRVSEQRVVADVEDVLDRRVALESGDDGSGRRGDQRAVVGIAIIVRRAHEDRVESRRRHDELALGLEQDRLLLALGGGCRDARPRGDHGVRRARRSQGERERRARRLWRQRGGAQEIDEREEILVRRAVEALDHGRSEVRERADHGAAHAVDGTAGRIGLVPLGYVHCQAFPHLLCELHLAARIQNGRLTRHRSNATGCRPSLQFHATVLLAEPDASAENQQRGEEHPQWERLEHHPVDHDGNRGHQGEIHFRWSSVERHVPLPFRRLVNRRRVRGKTDTRD